MIVRVLESMGATMWARGTMYKAVVESLLLCGIKSWLVTREMLKVLMGFHRQVVQRITGMMAKCEAGREWEYPVVEEAVDSAGLHPIRLYI